MSDGDSVERMIEDWLERNYPRGPTWYDRAKEGTLPAIEIRMIPAFVAVEYNISNGGWAQFLWNCFPHWRAIIADAKEGYLLVGTPELSVALDSLHALCERDESECRAAQKQMEAGVWLFGEFTSRSYMASSNGWEHLFWDDALYEKRLAWLSANEARVRKALGMPD
jgi:hypothetical protein